MDFDYIWKLENNKKNEMKVLFIEKVLQDVPERTCVLDFSDAGPYRDCYGKGNYQIWDELIKPSSKLVLFNDPIRMGEIYAMDVNDMIYNIPKTRDMIKQFLLWLARKKWVDVIYILCSKNSFVRKIQF
jgi:hypothetical protein